MEKNKKLRDSDNKLMVRIWREQITDPDMSLTEFFLRFARDEFVKPEAIRRARQKVQEQEPSLRGNDYKGKQAEAEIVRLGIGEV